MRRSRQRGFTLIELMVVISIVIILMSVAIPRYQASILRARETVLRDDLYALRSVIDQYTLDKQKAPQSLQELVDSGYLKTLPVDPFTNSRETWVPVSDDSIMSPDQTKDSGIQPAPPPGDTAPGRVGASAAVRS